MYRHLQPEEKSHLSWSAHFCSCLSWKVIVGAASVVGQCLEKAGRRGKDSDLPFLTRVPSRLRLQAQMAVCISAHILTMVFLKGSFS